MISLFCGDYEKTLRFIFDFYDFDGNLISEIENGKGQGKERRNGLNRR